jgi:hypothetical protein
MQNLKKIDKTIYDIFTPSKTMVVEHLKNTP